ncbi:hypothetical protein EYF80_060987 [Liparis tanakae]|uniref:Uncharacterized protein n=1 Tax=Liparis tanakae TaxID=230148 RepID=A0A4Z2EJD1_9TELE|nr:hypothetical protein EYF80_060987 [Liparis tanakae]
MCTKTNKHTPAPREEPPLAAGRPRAVISRRGSEEQLRRPRRTGPLPLKPSAALCRRRTHLQPLPPPVVTAARHSIITEHFPVSGSFRSGSVLSCRTHRTTAPGPRGAGPSGCRALGVPGPRGAAH